jgi:NADH:ubiquinone oxidoreductase subunit
MDLGIYLLTWWQGRFVGTDSFGNRYFEEKRPKAGRRQKRWVLYKNKAEASKVPAEWHGWLHYTFLEPPTPYDAKPWQKPHLPNMTQVRLAETSQGCPPHSSPISNQKSPHHYEPWEPTP